MTNEELDFQRAKEALHRSNDFQEAALVAARLAREGWTPPEPVDPDLLAWRKWETRSGTPYSVTYRKSVLEGKWDYSTMSKTFLAGARMARNQEQERANPVVEYVQGLTTLGSDASISAISWGARATLAKYRGEV